MFNEFGDIAKKISDGLPLSLNNIKEDFEKKVKVILSGAFEKMDLVTREEFDIQTKVLERTRLKLDILEKEINKLLKDKNIDNI